MKDEILGVMKYHDDAWVREEKINIYGTNRDVTIEIRAEIKSSLEVQKNAYKTYMLERERYIKQIPQIFLAEYLYDYEDIESRVEFSENSPLLRKNISESTIVKTFAPVVVFFDEKGNYGWICKCGWTKDKTSAVLLSESRPLVLTPNQLRNLHKLNDNTFGTLIHDGKKYWTTWDKLPYYGEEVDVRVEVEGSVDEGVNSIQQKVYTDYLMHKDDHLRRLSNAMLPVYLGNKTEAEKFIASGQKVGVKTVLPKRLVIDKNGNFGWICYTQWDGSYIGVLLSEDKIQIMGESHLREFSQIEKIKDEKCGYVFRTHFGWEQIVLQRFFNEDIKTLPVSIRTYDKKPDERQLKKLSEYYLYDSAFWEGIKDELLPYYLYNYNVFESYLEIPETLNEKNVNRDNVVSILTFTKLFISIDARIAWLCESPTDQEDGLAFEFTEGKIKLIGQPDII